MVLAVQRTSDPANLLSIKKHFEKIANIPANLGNLNTQLKVSRKLTSILNIILDQLKIIPSLENLEILLSSTQVIVPSLFKFLKHYYNNTNSKPNYRATGHSKVAKSKNVRLASLKEANHDLTFISPDANEKSINDFHSNSNRRICPFMPTSLTLSMSTNTSLSSFSQGYDMTTAPHYLFVDPSLISPIGSLKTSISSKPISLTSLPFLVRQPDTQNSMQNISFMNTQNINWNMSNQLYSKNQPSSSLTYNNS